MRTEQEKRESRESAVRRFIGVGGKARGKHSRRNQPAGNILGSIHPDLAIARADARERNAERAAMGLPKVAIPKEQRPGCSNLAFVVVELRPAKPIWRGNEHGKGRCACHSTISPDMALPPLSERKLWKQPTDPTQRELIDAMLSDCKRFVLILTRTGEPHTREIRGTGISIEAMLRRSPEWVQSWQYAIDAAVPRGIPIGTGTVGDGAKRRIAEGKREAIAKAEDRQLAIDRAPAPMQPETSEQSERAEIVAYLATFGIKDLLRVVSWVKPIMAKRDIPLLDSSGKPAVDSFGNILYRKDSSGNVIQEWYKVKDGVETTTTQVIASRMIGMEKLLQHLAAIADDTDAVDAMRTDANSRLDKLIGEYKVWEQRLQTSK